MATDDTEIIPWRAVKQDTVVPPVGNRVLSLEFPDKTFDFPTEGLDTATGDYGNMVKRLIESNLDEPTAEEIDQLHIDVFKRLKASLAAASQDMKLIRYGQEPVNPDRRYELYSQKNDGLAGHLAYLIAMSKANEGTVQREIEVGESSVLEGYSVIHPFSSDHPDGPDGEFVLAVVEREREGGSGMEVSLDILTPDEWETVLLDASPTD